MRVAMRSATKYALLLGTCGLASSAVSRVSHLSSELAPLWWLDVVGVILLALCLIMLFLAREDYPEFHSKYLILAMLSLAVGYGLMYSGFALQNFSLDSLNKQVKPDISTFWTSAGIDRKSVV
jgi:drug/metabolite transporter (DMT)-like permease